MRFRVTCDTGLLDAAAVRDAHEEGGADHIPQIPMIIPKRATYSLRFERAAGCVFIRRNCRDEYDLKTKATPFPGNFLDLVCCTVLYVGDGMLVGLSAFGASRRLCEGNSMDEELRIRVQPAW